MATQKIGLAGYLYGALLIALGLCSMLLFPYGTGAALGALSVAVVLAGRAHRKRLTELAAARTGESICGLARSFKRGSIDTWVIRAVYEEIQAYLGHKVPLRASDRLAEDLRLDDEDFNDDLAVGIAERSGRSLENMEANPWFGRVSTVGDLINFLDAQPRAA